MKCLILFSEKKIKLNIISLSSAELGQRVVKVDQPSASVDRISDQWLCFQSLAKSYLRFSKLLQVALLFGTGH